jgi:hypothetical protein
MKYFLIRRGKIMKKLYVILAVMLLLISSLFTGCGPEKEDGSAKDAQVEDYVIQWADPAVEALVRDYIGKPEGDILRSELDFVERMLIEGGVCLFINDVDKNGTEQWMSEIYPLYSYDINTQKEKITILWNGSEYEPRSISSCKDFLQFRNLRVLGLTDTEVADDTALSELPETCSVFYDIDSYSRAAVDLLGEEVQDSPGTSSSDAPVQHSSNSSDSSTGGLAGIWVDSAGITNSGGMSTLPPAIVFVGDSLYIGNWYSGVTPDEIISDIGTRGYDGPSGTYVLDSDKLKVTWRDGSTAEWAWDGTNFKTSSALFVPDGGSYSGKVEK